MVSDDRGQVLLVGSVVLAITLIAIVTLLNGVAYTEHVGGGDQDSYDEAKRVERSVVADLESMSASVGGGSASASQTELEYAADNYELAFGEITAANRPASLTVEFASADATGQAIVHDDPGEEFIPNNGHPASKWSPINSAGEAAPIESFEVSLQTTDIPQNTTSAPPSFEPFAIAVTEQGSPSTTRTIWINRTSLSTVKVTVDDNDDGSIDTTCSFVAGSHVDIDLVHGQIEGESCSFNSLADDSAQYSVEMRGAGPYPSSPFKYPTGTYKIVLEDDDTINNPGSDPRYSGGSAPNVQEEVMTASYTFVYETPALRYESTLEIEVDPDT